MSAKQDYNWLILDKYLGYMTKADPEKIPLGAHPLGQNTIINDGDRVSIRPLGLQLFYKNSTLDTSGKPITKIKTFHKRDGSQIFMQVKVYPDDSISLEYASPTQFEILFKGYGGSEFDFQEFNINSDLRSFIYFGNSVDDFSRWNGGVALLTATLNLLDATVTVDSTAGLTATGSIIVDGVTMAYTAITPTTITLTAPSTVAAAIGRGAAQIVETFPANPKGNIYLVSDNRLKIAGVKNYSSVPDPAQAVFCSAYADATSYNSTLVTSLTAASPCVFNLAEGGGPVLGMVSDEGTDYYAKHNITYKAMITDTLYSVTPIKSFDGKSQTLGILAKGGFFSSRNGVIAVTPDRQIWVLTRVEQIDYPQNLPISDAIKPTVQAMNLNSVRGIYFEDYVFIACTSPGSDVNDTVLVFNSKIGAWESPIVGWNVNDWAIYDDGNGESLYYADATSANVFKVIKQPNDNDFGIAANWRTGEINFGYPSLQKNIDMIYVQGYIAENTELFMNLLYDKNGSTAIYQTSLKGTETEYLFSNNVFNDFGLRPFGVERFGVNDDFSGKQLFRIYLVGDLDMYSIYTAQLEFASNGLSQNWEVTQCGFHWKLPDDPIDDELQKSFILPVN